MTSIFESKTNKYALNKKTGNIIQFHQRNFSFSENLTKNTLSLDRRKHIPAYRVGVAGNTWRKFHLHNCLGCILWICDIQVWLRCSGSFTLFFFRILFLMKVPTSFKWDLDCKADWNKHRPSKKIPSPSLENAGTFALSFVYLCF